MKLGARGKLFAVSLLLVISVVAATGAVAEGRLRTWLVGRASAELERTVQIARGAVERAPSLAGPGAADALADALAGAGPLRVTLIGAAGRVLGDSRLSAAGLAAADDHGARPEVIAARRDGVGAARRFSTTLNSDMLYVAVPYARLSGGGFVRVALPLTEIDEAVAGLRVVLLGAGLVGLLVALGMSGLASHLLSRHLRDLVVSARRVAGGGGERIAVSGTDEVNRLAGSLNRMADELQRTMSDLASERQRLGTVLEAMSEAVIALDEHLYITLANPAAVSLLGLDAAPVGRPLVEAVRTPALHGLARKGATEPAEAEFDLIGRARRRVLGHATPMRGAAGTVLVMVDVSAMRRLETVRTDFVANVSHELRTPVAVIRANAETLLDGALERPEAARRFAEAILRNADRLARMIADLLDLSRIEAGRYGLEIGDVDVAAATARAVEAVTALLGDKPVTVRAEAAPELLARADPEALHHVLLNLLENAIKYTPAGGHVRVEARAEAGRPDTVRLEVIDDGPGIEPRHRPRLFERFYRADAGRSRDQGGTGLGLAIVKHLVDGMGGAVGVEPARPHGSVFWVTLPACGGLAQPGPALDPASPGDDEPARS